MDYQVSARKYRPGTFQDVIGQPHVVQTLVNAITSGRIPHAFLFSGMRGVGKTTVARILAKALNCEHGPTGTPCDRCPNCTEIALGTSVDVIEIDGASNTGVDDVREIRENVRFTPFRGKYRVYIIDEVHMLSNSAFNALLKTLEEPPPHVVFVFATTEIHKIPATILSRCQHYNFRRIPRTEIIRRLRHVAEQDGLTVEERSLAAIARASEGSMRDALSLLDQAVSFSGKSIRHGDLETLLGSVPQELVRALISAVITRDSSAALQVVAQLLDQGHDLRAYCADLVEHVRNLLVVSVIPRSQRPHGLQGLLDLSEDDLRQVIADAEKLTIDQLQELFRIFTQTEDALKTTAHPRYMLEVAAIRATRVGLTAATPVQPGGTSTLRQPGHAGESKAVEAPRALPAERESSPPPAPLRAGQSPAPGKPAEGAEQPRVSLQGRQASSNQPTRVSAPAMSPASSRTPVSPPPSVTSQLRPMPPSPAQVQLSWQQLVEETESRHPSIGPFLAQGTLLSIEGNQITVGYPKTASVALTRMQKEETLRLISELGTELVGQPVRLRVVELANGQEAGPSLAQLRAEKERNQKQALLEQARSHPVVKQALEMFGGEVVEIRYTSQEERKLS